MNPSICGVDCSKCFMRVNCNTCAGTNGCPFGKQCFIARYIQLGGEEAYRQFKQELINEFNQLQIPGMPIVTDLNALAGSFVNLVYTLPSSENVRFLDDQCIYLGNQLESELGGNRCFGIVAGMDFLLVCTYEENGVNPELVLYKAR